VANDWYARTVRGPVVVRPASGPAVRGDPADDRDRLRPVVITVGVAAYFVGYFAYLTLRPCRQQARRADRGAGVRHRGAGVSGPVLAIVVILLATFAIAGASILQRRAGPDEPDEREFSVGLLFDLVRKPSWWGGVPAAVVAWGGVGWGASGGGVATGWRR